MGDGAMQAFDEQVTGEAGTLRLQGRVAPGYEPVLDAFRRNFEAHGEVGASVCVTVEGQPVIDAWGGLADPQTQAPWQEHTISIVFSVTKAATALCAHLLVDRGELDLHAKVSKYWPEFAQAGKEDATVEMMLNHSVGLPAFKEKVKDGGFYDWDYTVDLLARSEPFWKPGTRNGYHMISFGWTVGELVRRVSGRSLGTFFRDEVAGPLGLPFWIGLPEAEEPRVAPMIAFRPDPADGVSPFLEKVMGDPTSIQHLALMNFGGFDHNTREAHAAEIGGGGGISNARGLAGMFTPLANGGEHAGGRLLAPETIARMRRTSVATLEDATLLIPSHFALGFMKSMDNRHLGGAWAGGSSAILGERAFGHVGMGGHLGFADPECGLAFGYTMNRMGGGILLNERGQALVDAAYRCLGYTTDAAGYWARG